MYTQREAVDINDRYLYTLRNNVGSTSIHQVTDRYIGSQFTGLINTNCSAKCPEDCNNGLWIYYSKSDKSWKEDSSITIIQAKEKGYHNIMVPMKDKFII